MNRWQARLAVAALRRGDVVLHATEGVWGFACDPFDPAAVARVLDLKGRSMARGLIVIGADADAFAPELGGLDAAERAAVLDTWPGAVTWVLPDGRFADWITGGRATVAVRVPGHPQARALCRAFGAPLVSTSANRAGHPPARSRIQARAVVRDLSRRGLLRGGRVHFLPGETLGRGAPSEIREPGGARLRGGP